MVSFSSSPLIVPVPVVQEEQVVQGGQVVQGTQVELDAFTGGASSAGVAPVGTGVSSAPVAVAVPAMMAASTPAAVMMSSPLNVMISSLLPVFTFGTIGFLNGILTRCV